MKVTPASRRRLLTIAWVIGIGSYVAMLMQKIGFEVASLGNAAALLVGTIIVLRRPGNVIGSIIVTVGAGWLVVVAADVTAETLATAGRIEAAGWVALVAQAATTPLLWLNNIALWLLFPEGRTQSIRAERFLRFSGVYAVLVMLVGVFSTPRVLGPGAPTQPHPFLDASVAESVSAVFATTVGMMFLAGLVAAGMLIARSRHSSVVERRQIQWVALAVIVYIVLTLVNGMFHPLGSPEDRAFLVLDAVNSLVLAGGIGVAITRYRLYEIDRIISRSVTFGGLAIFIAGVYVAIVVGVGRLLGGEAGFGLSVAASVLVALAFQPIRRRVERWANRLVYGERATPHEVLVRFSHRSSELSDEELLGRIPQLMVDGTGARSAALWTRRGDGFTTAAVWPVDAGVRTLGGGDGFEDPEADFSLPVFHDGELLGGLSLGKEPGEPVTPAEEGLLADLASGLGLALRNARLTGELRRQVEELETSRQRVLAVADAARRELENTLDSGPQQQLVALKVKLGPTRKRAEQLGAVKTADLLGQLEQQAGDAIKAVRELAGGIYPPLLEAEGLVVAIGQQARAAAIPVSIDGDGLDRYPRDVEAAVYFSVLEALQNVGKYAEASTVTVTLSANDGMLTFQVVDDGRGFDPASVAPGAGLNGIADRLDTIGGTMHVDSAPGAGTTITGTIPIRDAIQAGA
jgi:signal transduction histidine kinase